ncbi:hypothetical protein [Acidithiobacillus ferridurans]|uniref:hypothetical protein n=1 Tax=Acidithiobacillus ferridurans TaxID=1232575 RepID=UPI001F2899E0|nr:hypothetical protein [Acidithiobacillus ferridurans]
MKYDFSRSPGYGLCSDQQIFFRTVIEPCKEREILKPVMHDAYATDAGLEHADGCGGFPKLPGNCRDAGGHRAYTCAYVPCAKFWMKVFNDPKTRSVADILIAVTE